MWRRMKFIDQYSIQRKCGGMKYRVVMRVMSLDELFVDWFGSIWLMEEAKSIGVFEFWILSIAQWRGWRTRGVQFCMRWHWFLFVVDSSNNDSHFIPYSISKGVYHVDQIVWMIGFYQAVDIIRRSKSFQLNLERYLFSHTWMILLFRNIQIKEVIWFERLWRMWQPDMCCYWIILFDSTNIQELTFWHMYVVEMWRDSE